MRTFLSLVRKDFLLEVRTLQTIVTMASLMLLLSVVCMFGVSSAFLKPATVARLYPTLLWIVFLFMATVSMGRAYVHEFESDALEGLLLQGVSPVLMYCSKVLTFWSLVSACTLLLAGVLAVLLQVSVVGVIPGLLLLVVLVVFAYICLAVLLAALSARTSLQGLMLPLLMLPLLFPVFFAALELTQQLMINNSLPLGSWWFTLLLVMDIVYFVAGLNLYEFVVRD